MRFRQIRESIYKSREDIVRRTELSVGTVRNAEKGRVVRSQTAYQLFHAINILLAEAGKQPLERLEDLELCIS